MRPVVYRAARPSTPDDANPHPTRTEPGAPRPPRPPGTLRPLAAPVHRERRRPPDAVRAQRLHRDWSRLEGFERGALTRALERGTVVQATLMRSTIHMVSRRDYWPIVTAVREHRRRWWLQATRHAMSERELETWAGRIRAALADGPQRRSALVKELGMDSTTWNGATGWIDLVRMPPSGTWERRRADLYGLAEDWMVPPLPTSPRIPASNTWFDATSPGSGPLRARTSRASAVCRSPRWTRRSTGSASGGS